MNRLTTDNPQNNLEELMNLAYGEDRKAMIRWHGETDEPTDLCEYASKCCQEKGCNKTAHEILENGLHCDCPIATMYILGIAAAELRGRLKMYEDISETPKQMQELIEKYKDLQVHMESEEDIAHTESWHDELTILKLRQENEELKARLEKSVELPCKVDDIVFAVGKSKIKKCRVLEIGTESKSNVLNIHLMFDCDDDCDGCPFNRSLPDFTEIPDADGGCECEYGDVYIREKEIGKTVFLTREDAVKALKEREQNV